MYTISLSLPTCAYKQATQRVVSCLKPKEKPSAGYYWVKHLSVSVSQEGCQAGADVSQTRWCRESAFWLQAPYVLHNVFPLKANDTQDSRTSRKGKKRRKRNKEVTPPSAYSILLNGKWLVLVQLSNTLKSHPSPRWHAGMLLWSNFIRQ